MKKSSHWYIKIKDRATNTTLVFYEDGRVYVDKGAFIGYLKDMPIKKIIEYVEETMPTVREYGYHVQENDGLITKFWDICKKKRQDLVVVGWKYDIFVLEILLTTTNYRRTNLDNSAFADLVERFVR